MNGYLFLYFVLNKVEQTKKVPNLGYSNVLRQKAQVCLFKILCIDKEFRKIVKTYGESHSTQTK